MTRFPTIFALGLGVACVATPAMAQSANCAPRQAVIDRLANHFGESRQSIGLTSDDRVIEMYASTETGTWTLTMTLPTGLMCVVGAGQAFERIEADATPAGQPT